MRRVVIALAAVFLLLLCFARAEEGNVLVRRGDAPGFSFAPEKELIQIYFPSLREEDCALILCGGDAVLIDCGSRNRAWAVTDMLRRLGVEEIDLIINTHPHNDHLLGLEEIALAVKVHAIAFAFPENETEHMQVALKIAARHGIEVKRYENAARFHADGAVIDAWLMGDPSWSLNDRSAQIRIQFGERTALFMADAEKNLQARMLEQMDPALLDCDLLKYPHHGLEPMNEELLLAISPAYAVMTSTSRDTTFAARQGLSRLNIPYGLTSSGWRVFTTDGEIWLEERLFVPPARNR